jgi:hypothetical protein
MLLTEVLFAMSNEKVVQDVRKLPRLALRKILSFLWAVVRKASETAAGLDTCCSRYEGGCFRITDVTANQYAAKIS